MPPKAWRRSRGELGGGKGVGEWGVWTQDLPDQDGMGEEVAAEEEEMEAAAWIPRLVRGASEKCLRPGGGGGGAALNPTASTCKHWGGSAGSHALTYMLHLFEEREMEREERREEGRAGEGRLMSELEGGAAVHWESERHGAPAGGGAGKWKGSGVQGVLRRKCCVIAQQQRLSTLVLFPPA